MQAQPAELPTASLQALKQRAHQLLESQRSLQQQNQALAAERLSYKSERDQRATQYQELSAERDALQAERDSLTAQLQELTAQRDSIQQQWETLQTTVEELKGQLNAQSTQTAEQSQQGEVLQGRVEELQGQRNPNLFMPAVHNHDIADYHNPDLRSDATLPTATRDNDSQVKYLSSDFSHTAEYNDEGLISSSLMGSCAYYKSLGNGENTRFADSMHCPFCLIAREISEGKKISFIPNPGNLGDAVILAATLQAFEYHSIKISHIGISKSPNPREWVHVYGGGGNLVPMYDDGRSVINKLSKLESTLIVLPHSSFGIEEELVRYKGKMIFFARDERTFNSIKALESRSSRIQVLIFPDIAFYLRTNDSKLGLFHKIQDLFADIPKANRPSAINCFRTDNERMHGSENLVNHSGRNHDLSLFWPIESGLNNGFELDFLDLSLVYNSAGWFLSMILIANQINTDRLHIAIAAHLLGINASLYDNCYGKNHSVVNLYSMLTGDNLDHVARVSSN